MVRKKNDLESKYPSIEFTYPIAVDSYEVATKRLEAADNRLQTLLTFVVTVSAVVPTFADKRGVDFHSGWFYSAIATFGLIVFAGTYARLSGSPIVLSPEFLYEGWLHKEEWEFKKDFIIFASEDFVHNLLIAERKWKYSVLITILFVLEAVLLAVWVFRS